MYKIIGADKREYGPISIDQMKKWISERRVDGQTMVQAEGSTEWKPLSAIPELAILLGGGVTGAQIPSAPPSLISEPEIFSPEEVLSRPISFSIEEAFSRGLKLFKENLGMSLGVATLFIFIFVVTSLVTRILPILGDIILTVVMGALLAGLNLFFLKLIRKEPTEFGDFFLGFQKNFLQLALFSVISQLILGIILAILLIIFFFPVLAEFWEIMNQTAMGDSNQAAEELTKILGMTQVIGLFVILAVFFLFWMLWWFGFALTTDKGLNFWEALVLSTRVVLRSFFRNALFLVLSLILVFLGLLACCVGVIPVLAILGAVFTSIYEDIFGRQAIKTT